MHVALLVGTADPDRAFDGHVAVGRRLLLGTESGPAGGAEERELLRRAAGDDADVAAGLVDVPDRYGERAAAGLRDGEDGDVRPGEERLALGAAHREGRHARSYCLGPAASSESAVDDARRLVGE